MIGRIQNPCRDVFYGLRPARILLLPMTDDYKARFKLAMRHAGFQFDGDPSWNRKLQTHSRVWLICPNGHKVKTRYERVMTQIQKGKGICPTCHPRPRKNWKWTANTFKRQCEKHGTNGWVYVVKIEGLSGTYMKVGKTSKASPLERIGAVCLGFEKARLIRLYNGAFAHQTHYAEESLLKQLKAYRVKPPSFAREGRSEFFDWQKGINRIIEIEIGNALSAKAFENN